MSEMPGLPSEVPSELRQQLARFQRQLKILLSNHQILVSRAENDPEDLVVLRQIEEVKKYLISFSNQQNVVLEKVRNFLGNLEEEKRRRNHDWEVLGPPPPGPIATKPKPRKKDKRKSKDFFSAKNSRSASPDLGDSDSDQTYLAYLIPGDSQYRGHTEDYSVPCPSLPLCEDPPESDCVRVQEPAREPDTKEQYMLRLELLTTQEVEVLHSQQERQRRRKRKGQRTVSAYIPDVVDKKYRYQTFLQGSTTSPPHLRRRTPAPTVGSLPRAAKTFSFPLETRMGTRSKSPSIARSQLDGVCDWSDEEMEVGEESTERLVTGAHSTDRLEVRDGLRKRRKELEEEMARLQARQEWLCEVRQAQKENRELLLKQQKETEAKIAELLQVVAGRS